MHEVNRVRVLNSYLLHCTVDRFLSNISTTTYYNYYNIVMPMVNVDFPPTMQMKIIYKVNRYDPYTITHDKLLSYLSITARKMCFVAAPLTWWHGSQRS